MEKTQKIKFLISFAFAAVVFAALPAVASAASLYFSPSSGSHAVGSTFSVSVYVSSADQAMNAASGVISFPSDKLEVTSLSKSGSIFTLWVQEPSFSNSAGTVNFEGIVLNPGFTGSSGKAITITFRTKAAGNAPLAFSSGSALANDGQGTNILTSLGNASFSLGAEQPVSPEIITPSQTIGAPAAPKISSPTHPDPNKWYANKNPKFNWSVPSDVTGVRLLVGKIPAAVPTITYTPAISGKEITNLADGVWYFHAQFRNAKGWGEITHFKLQIDTEPPKQFDITFPHGTKSDDPRPVALFNTIDSLSGISRYEAKIGEEDLLKIDPREIESNPYGIPLQSPGKRTIIVKAFDEAGNETTAVGEFEVDPLKAPKIIRYPEMLDANEILIIEGETYIDAVVIVSIKNERGEVESRDTRSNGVGFFRMIWPKKIAEGVYAVSASVTDNRGAKSLESEPLTFRVASPKFLTIGGQAITILAVIVPLVVLIFALLFIIWYGWHKFGSFRKKLGRIKKEVREAESALHKAFDSLKDDVREQVKILEKTKTKRQLTEEEERIIKQLRKDLDDAEKFVRKEIEDIEKAVK